MSLLNPGALFNQPVIIELLHDVQLNASNRRVAAVALLGPERQRPTMFYSSSFSMWRGLVGSRAGPRRRRRCPLPRCRRAAPRQSGGKSPLVAGRVGPQRSRRCPLPRCWRRGASAEQGLVDASGAGTRRSRHCPLPRPRSHQIVPRPLHRPLC